ncbi:diguanylate cyclase [Paenibacillus sp. NPDC093718]|uniref:sensor domain-containing diguanylate cyclase n=1 Tax=Paenibacillus sp. NPDC093718 TaxID=3390601 RepID=UPI003D08A268
MLTQIIPSFVILTAYLVMLIMAVIFYRRWKTSEYGFLAITLAANVLVFSSYGLFLLSQEEPSVRSFTTILGTTSIMTIAGLYRFFKPKKHKEFLFILIGTGLLFLLGLISTFVNGLSIFVMLLDIVACGAFIYWMTRELPKRKLFIAAVGTAGFSYLMNVLFIAANTYFFHHLFLLGQFLFCLIAILIFFDRIVDMVYAVSYKSVTDGLTGLYYKSFFVKKVDEAVQGKQPATVIFSDIDNFKQVNDTQGHLVGDQILKLVGQIMKEVCQEIGIAGRYGGEEIVGLITDSKADPSVIAERFRSRVEQESGAIYPVTVSVGYSSRTNHIESGEQLIHQADDALYLAKTSGKNKVVNYADDRSEHQDQFASVPLQELIVEAETAHSFSGESEVEPKPIFEQAPAEADEEDVALRELEQEGFTETVQEIEETKHDGDFPGSDLFNKPALVEVPKKTFKNPFRKDE